MSSICNMSGFYMNPLPRIFKPPTPIMPFSYTTACTLHLILTRGLRFNIRGEIYFVHVWTPSFRLAKPCNSLYAASRFTRGLHASTDAPQDGLPDKRTLNTERRKWMSFPRKHREQIRHLRTDPEERQKSAWHSAA